MNRLPQWLADAGALLIKVGKWVAGFSFWQFVVFSLLVLVAGGIVDSALFPDRTRTRGGLQEGPARAAWRRSCARVGPGVRGLRGSDTAGRRQAGRRHGPRR